MRARYCARIHTFCAFQRIRLNNFDIVNYYNFGFSSFFFFFYRFSFRRLLLCECLSVGVCVCDYMRVSERLLLWSCSVLQRALDNRVSVCFPLFSKSVQTLCRFVVSFALCRDACARARPRHNTLLFISFKNVLLASKLWSHKICNDTNSLLLRFFFFSFFFVAVVVVRFRSLFVSIFRVCFPLCVFVSFFFSSHFVFVVFFSSLVSVDFYDRVFFVHHFINERSVVVFTRRCICVPRSIAKDIDPRRLVIYLSINDDQMYSKNAIRRLCEMCF